MWHLFINYITRLFYITDAFTSFKSIIILLIILLIRVYYAKPTCFCSCWYFLCLIPFSVILSIHIQRIKSEVQTASACYGNENDCNFMTLECNSGERIRLLSLGYGIKEGNCNSNVRRNRCTRWVFSYYFLSVCFAIAYVVMFAIEFCFNQYAIIHIRFV